MKKLKKIIAENFTSFTYFYRHLGYRIFIALILSLLVGLLDSIGLSMFLPLLQMVDGETNADGASLGKLQFIADGIQSLGLSLNLTVVLSFLCIFFIAKGIAQFIRSYYQVSVQQYFIKNVRLKLVKSINRLSYKTFVVSDVGQIQNTLSGEVDRVSRAYQTYFTAFQYMILVLVYVGVAFFVDIQFALLVSLGGGVTNVLYKTIYKNTKGASLKLTAESHVFQSLIIQYISNFKYLKSSGLLSKYSNKLDKSVNIIENNNRKIGYLTSILGSSREPLLIIVVCFVIYLQISVLGAKLGPILISLLIFYRCLAALTMMQSQWNFFIGVAGSLENMTKFTTELQKNSETSGSIQLTKFTDEILLNNIAFKYNKDNILNNINLTISKNETVAFVGESGSGKTTLVNILVGLMPVTEGQMSIDNISSKDIDMLSYQKRIGYITQDAAIFNDTIFNNITFWGEKNPQNLAKFKNAITKASIMDFIETLPEKEDTILGNAGVNLSGGQKQRISIARELYKDIDVLVLDEATSALDSETERIIQDNIDALKGEYTMFIVAHRLSTIKNADRIVLMDKGTITATGSFNELIAISPRFKKMVELQEL